VPSDYFIVACPGLLICAVVYDFDLISDEMANSFNLPPEGSLAWLCTIFMAWIWMLGAEGVLPFGWNRVGLDV
jgi:hypothetical protein